MASCGPSNHELASLASHGAIQSDAPIKATSSIIIDAPEERVWRTLVNVRAWPHWQPGVDKVDGAAVLSTGAAFSWQTDGTTSMRKSPFHRHRIGLLGPGTQQPPEPSASSC